MADLMSGGMVSFSNLTKKYSNFMVPAMKIKVQGSDIIASLGLLVESMTVIHALEGAGSCQFTLAGVYDVKKRQFDSAVLSKLKLGTILTVELGYGSATTMVFKGYVHETTVQYSEFPVLQITAMDVRKLMMVGAARMNSFTVNTYSDIFTTIMQDYQKICTTLVIDKTSAQLKGERVFQTVSDYKFIQKNLVPRGSREFFVLAGKAYYRTPRKNEQPITELTWGGGLLSLERSASYLNTEVSVRGYDEQKAEVYLSKVVARASDQQTSATAAPQVLFMPDPDATDNSRATDRAKELAESLENESMSASGTCIGLPELVPGRYIKLSKLGNGMDQSYYITKVTHTLGADGFSSSFEVEGWT